MLYLKTMDLFDCILFYFYDISDMPMVRYVQIANLKFVDMLCHHAKCNNDAKCNKVITFCVYPVQRKM